MRNAKAAMIATATGTWLAQRRKARHHNGTWHPAYKPFHWTDEQLGAMRSLGAPSFHWLSRQAFLAEMQRPYDKRAVADALGWRRMPSPVAGAQRQR